jgi:hypothetical protein
LGRISVKLVLKRYIKSSRKLTPKRPRKWRRLSDLADPSIIGLARMLHLSKAARIRVDLRSHRD